MGFFKKAGATVGLTALLIGLDCVAGDSTCATAYDRQMDAAPNGDSTGAAVSLYADHFDEMSPYAKAATFTPLAGLALFTGLYIKRKVQESKKRKEK